MLEDNRQPLRDRMSRVNRQESSLSHLPRLARQPVLLPHRRWGRSMEVQVSEFAEYGDVHVRDSPSGQWIRVNPSDRLPSSVVKSTGSFVTEIPYHTRLTCNNIVYCVMLHNPSSSLLTNEATERPLISLLQ